MEVGVVLVLGPIGGPRGRDSTHIFLPLVSAHRMRLLSLSLHFKSHVLAGFA